MKKTSELTEAEMAAKLVKGVEKELDSDMISGPRPTQELTDERHNTHGDWEVQASFAYRMKENAYETPQWAALNLAQREAIDMIFTKISRILHGDCKHRDHWEDIAGYAKLVADRL